MDEEEPAWRAELRKAIGEAVIAASCDGECGLSEDDCASEHPIRVAAWTFDVVSDIEAPVNWIAAVADTALVPHIKAAEERGRREALKQHVDGLKADWGRFRGRVLQEAWEALRDAEGGPLVDGMSVINRLLESP